MSNEQQEPRRRRRALWFVLALVFAILLGSTAFAVLAPGRTREAMPAAAASKAPETGFAIVSPPQAAAGGNGQGNNGVGNGNGGSTQPTPAPTSPAPSPSTVPNGNTNGQATGKSLTASFRSVTPLFPGHSGTLTLRVENPNSQDVLLTGVASTVTSVTSGNRPGIPRCDKSWFVIGNLSGTPRVVGRGATDITLPVSMVNTAKVNQDNCKSATYSFSFTVNGRQA